MINNPRSDQTPKAFTPKCLTMNGVNATVTNTVIRPLARLTQPFKNAWRDGSKLIVEMAGLAEGDCPLIVSVIIFIGD